MGPDRPTIPKVVVAPGPFKGALPPAASARAIAAGLRLSLGRADIAVVPVADGGEGTLDALVGALNGRRRMVAVSDPLGRPVDAAIGELPNRAAVVELAQASGYERLLAHERDPEQTGTHGTGELIRAALDLGATTITVGVGGSATTDGGLGLACALGVRAFDSAGHQLVGHPTDMAKVERLDLSALDPRLAGVRLRVACDVDTPFCGPQGAARTFGPQKGADAAAVERLDAGLAHLGRVMARDGHVDPRTLGGAGAAGGAAGGLAALLRAELLPGAPLILEAVGLERHLGGADLCVTGEGSLDATSLAGKAPVAVARAAHRRGVPCVGLCGRLDLGPRAIAGAGFTAAFAIGARPRRGPDALAETEADLARTAASVGAVWASGAG